VAIDWSKSNAVSRYSCFSHSKQKDFGFPAGLQIRFLVVHDRTIKDLDLLSYQDAVLQYFVGVPVPVALSDPSPVLEKLMLAGLIPSGEEWRVEDCSGVFFETWTISLPV
jgi:hypothetical protein